MLVMWAISFSFYGAAGVVGHPLLHPEVRCCASFSLSQGLGWRWTQGRSTAHRALPDSTCTATSVRHCALHPAGLRGWPKPARNH
eukprot:scaffold120250_cov22-Tisochrysis_lutea.AAC.1